MNLHSLFSIKRRTGRSHFRIFLLTIAALGVLNAQARTAANANAIPEIIDISDSVAATPAGGQLVTLQQQYREQMSSGQLEQALESAKQIVSGSAVVWGENSEQVASALTNLAITQADNAEYGAAQQNFIAAINVREELTGGIVDPTLVNPLKGLATTAMALNDVEQAIPVFERAIHLSHVNLGPNNLEQVDVMDALSRAYYFLGELRRANKIQENLFRLQRRNFERDSDQYIDALLGQARWYGETRDFTRAMLAYKAVVNRMNRAYGELDRRLVEPRVEMAFVAPGTSIQDQDLGQAAILADKDRAISRAVRIARQTKDADPVLYAQTLAKKGDFHAANFDARSARLAYLQSWRELDGDPKLHSIRNELFDAPKPARVIPIRNTHKRVPPNSPGEMALYKDRGFVELQFTVNALGRPITIEVIDSQPAGLMDKTVVRGLRNFRFRPRFVNGRPVATPNQTFRHDFRYSDERLSPGERRNIEKTEAARTRAAAKAENPPGIVVDDADGLPVDSDAAEIVIDDAGGLPVDGEESEIAIDNAGDLPIDNEEPEIAIDDAGGLPVDNEEPEILIDDADGLPVESDDER